MADSANDEPKCFSAEKSRPAGLGEVYHASAGSVRI